MKNNDKELNVKGEPVKGVSSKRINTLNLDDILVEPKAPKTPKATSTPAPPSFSLDDVSVPTSKHSSSTIEDDLLFKKPSTAGDSSTAEAKTAQAEYATNVLSLTEAEEPSEPLARSPAIEFPSNLELVEEQIAEPAEVGGINEIEHKEELAPSTAKAENAFNVFKKEKPIEPVASEDKTKRGLSSLFRSSKRKGGDVERTASKEIKPKKAKGGGMSSLLGGLRKKPKASSERVEPMVEPMEDAPFNEGCSPKVEDNLGDSTPKSALGAFQKKAKGLLSKDKKIEIGSRSKEKASKNEVFDAPKHSAIQVALAKALPSLYKLPVLDENAPIKRGPVSSRLSGDLPLMVELDGGALVYYRLTEKTLVPAEEFEMDKALSFSPYDRRYLIERTASFQKATDAILSDGLSEEVRIVNTAKQLGSVHGTDLERVKSSEVALGPGLALVEFALVGVERPKTPHVLCILLSDEEEGRSLAILYHCDIDGEFDAPQISVNPSNLGFTLAQFQSSRGLPADVPVIQVTNEDLMAVSSEFRLYPQEGMWRGIPISRILWSAALVGTIAAVGTSAMAGMTYLELESTKKVSADFRNKSRALDVRGNQLISSSLISFGRLQSMDIDEVYQRASEIWIPRTTMNMVATNTTQDFKVSMPLAGGGFFNNLPSVLKQIQNENVEQLLELTPPEGCTKQLPGVSGGVNVIQISISCENHIGGLSRYNGD